MLRKINSWLFIFIFTFTSAFSFNVKATGVEVFTIGALVDLLATLSVTYGVMEVADGFDVVRNKNLVSLDEQLFKEYGINTLAITEDEYNNIVNFYNKAKSGVSKIGVTLQDLLDMGIDKVANALFSNATYVPGGIDTSITTGVPSSVNLSDTPYYFVWLWGDTDLRFTLVAPNYTYFVDSYGWYVRTTSSVRFIYSGGKWSYMQRNTNTVEGISSIDTSKKVIGTNIPEYQSLFHVGEYVFEGVPDDILVNDDTSVPFAFPDSTISTSVLTGYAGVGDVSGEKENEKVGVGLNLKDWHDTLVNQGALVGGIDTPVVDVPSVDYPVVESPTLEGVSGWLSSFWDTLLDLLSYVFIPSPDFFNNNFNKLKNSFTGKLGFPDDNSLLSWLENVRGKSRIYEGTYFGQTVTFFDVGIWDKYKEIFFGFLRGLFAILLIFFNYKMVLFIVRGTHFMNGENGQTQWRSLADGSKTSNPFSKSGGKR